MNQITTITFFRYPSLKSKVWAFGMMQFAHPYLQRTAGLEFYKLMGSGKDKGFNPYPDWSVYALLQVWESEEHADHFFRETKLIKKYRSQAFEMWTIYMRSIVAKGEWSGGNPFRKSGLLDPQNTFLAVITRATIKLSKLRTFWKYVPTSEKPLEGNNGLLYTKGIGEVPALQMATFSIWKDDTSLKQFAYQSKEHHRAIQMTRELGWYKEELFSRFQPFKSVGTWGGLNPLPF